MSCSKVFFKLLIILSIFALKVHCEGEVESENVIEGENGSTCRYGDWGVECGTLRELVYIENPENQPLIVADGGLLDEDARLELEFFICEEEGVFRNFTATTQIWLTDVNVLQIHEGCFAGVDKLKTVDLTKNFMTTINMKSFRVTEEMEVENIYFQNNHISHMIFGDVVLPELRNLNVVNNRLTEIRINSKMLPKINELNLAGNQISTFHLESRSMQILNLTQNRIKAFDRFSLMLPNLKILLINDNLLTTITPPMMLNVPLVTDINFGHNKLMAVNFPILRRLVRVDLGYNGMRNIGAVNITYPVLLFSLILDGNNFVHLGRNPSHINSRTIFLCESCSLRSIDRYFFYNTFKKLEILNLKSNYLTTANIFRTTNANYTSNLKNVILSYNRIRRIGKSDFAKLKILIAMALDNNEISTILEGAFDGLEKLQILDLTNNMLFTLPGDLFRNTAALTDLSFTGNNMAYFPIPGWQEGTEEISTEEEILSKLDKFYIAKNPLQCQCVDLLHTWAKVGNFTLVIDDENVRTGKIPSCIVNKEGCKTDVEKDYVRDYWYIFNDESLNNFFYNDEDDVE